MIFSSHPCMRDIENFGIKESLNSLTASLTNSKTWTHTFEGCEASISFCVLFHPQGSVKPLFGMGFKSPSSLGENSLNASPVQVIPNFFRARRRRPSIAGSRPVVISVSSWALAWTERFGDTEETPRSGMAMEVITRSELVK